MTEQESKPDQDIFISKMVSQTLRSGQAYKFGIFAGIHGDEEAGILAVHELIRWATEKAKPIQQNYRLTAGRSTNQFAFDIGILPFISSIRPLKVGAVSCCEYRPTPTPIGRRFQPPRTAALPLPA